MVLTTTSQWLVHSAPQHAATLSICNVELVMVIMIMILVIMTTRMNTLIDFTSPPSFFAFPFLLSHMHAFF
jgi:hypothetical protein